MQRFKTLYKCPFRSINHNFTTFNKPFSNKNFLRRFSSTDEPEREVMEFDVCIVGAGPAGLSTAIKLKQLCKEKNMDLDVCILEKGSEVGSHIISGNVFNPCVLNELIPDWKDKNAPLQTKVTKDEFWFMSSNNIFKLPWIPPLLSNHGNYIISLADLCRWLNEQAEKLDITVLPGFSVSEALFNDKNQVIGVATCDRGRNKDGSIGSNFEKGTAIHAKQIVLSEGCRGSLSEIMMKKYNLRNECDPQVYGLGLKEVWEINPSKSKPGTVIHSLGWPLNSVNENNYGGGFIYYTNDNKVYIGFVVGLDYENPYLNPYLEFQKFKTHAKVREILEDGECISYGGRAINSGGYQSVPKLSFPGGLLVGDTGGFVNVPKIKGTHYAMKSGIIAAQTIFDALSKKADNNKQDDEQVLHLKQYDDAIKNSFIMKDLYNVRNFKPSFHKGFIPGLLHSALSTVVYGKEPWTLHNKQTCAEATKPKHECKEKKYDKPDGVLTFDILTNLQRTNTFHDENQPSHLVIKPELKHVAEHDSYNIYGAPETRFCPAKVYEFIEKDGDMKLVINSQNCIHCKSCDIKTPKEYIQWTVPEGGGGPKYGSM